MSKTAIAKVVADDVSHLDPEDPVRRGVLEKLADWLLCRKFSRRGKIWGEVEDRIERLDPHYDD